MTFKSIEKKEQGNFITRYDISYAAADGSPKTYEMISRNKNMASLADVRNKQPDSVIIIATDESGGYILLTKEFRMAVGDWVYNFPAGLIDPGESALQAAARELKEETGLILYAIDDILEPSYGSPGISNETSIVIIGKAKGEFKPSTSVFEEIMPEWHTKKNLQDLLKKKTFSARAQAYCYLWSRTP